MSNINFLRILGFAWASPVTFFGLLYVLAFMALKWYKFDAVHGDALVWTLDKNAAPGWLLAAWAGWGGHAIGNVVVMSSQPLLDKKTQTTLRHEQEHVRQCMTLGVFQPIVYALSYLALMTCRYSNPYYDNPFEVDARRAAGQPIDVVGMVDKLMAEGKLKRPSQKK